MSFAGGGLGENDLIQHYYYFLATDSVGQAVLDGQVISLALTAITGGARLLGTSAPTPAPRVLSSPESQRTNSSWRASTAVAAEDFPQPRLE